MIGAVDEPGARRRRPGRHSPGCQHRLEAHGDRRRLPLSACSEALADGARAGARLPRAAALRAEPEAQRRDLAYRHAGTAEGIENCEAIAAIDGIDVLPIGSGDLTTDLGIPGQVDHPRLRAAYERAASACRTHSKVLGVGGIRHNTVLQGELIRLGARFVIAGT